MGNVYKIHFFILYISYYIILFYISYTLYFILYYTLLYYRICMLYIVCLVILQIVVYFIFIFHYSRLILYLYRSFYLISFYPSSRNLINIRIFYVSIDILLILCTNYSTNYTETQAYKQIEVTRRQSIITAVNSRLRL